MTYVAELSLSATVDQLRQGRDLLEYVDATCDRLDEVQPAIEALLPEPGRRDRLYGEARTFTSRPPLYGVLVAVKDLFKVDGFATRAGSQLPAELFAGPEASAVSALRTAGALILGKTHTDEFAHSEPSPARNPHNPRHSPGGSSAGSAAAVAAGISPLALGTQTLRSVIGPAAFCGVVGFKPSYGRVPADGLVSMCPSIDTVGWLTQDAAGAALAASVVCPDWNASLATTVGSLPVVGVPESGLLTCATDEARQAFETQLTRLAESGLEVRHVRFLSDEDVVAALRLAGRLLEGEMAAVHAAWFDRYSDLYRPRTAAAILRGRAVGASELEQGRALQVSVRHEIKQVMDTAGVDVWALPSSNGPAPEGLEVTGWADMTGLWSYAGLPCVSLPAGFARNGLPLGVQLVAPFGADERLVAWATSLQSLLQTYGFGMPSREKYAGRPL